MCILCKVCILLFVYCTFFISFISRPGTRHEVSRGLDAGATRCPVSESVDPSSEESAKEGLSRGASALGTKSGWASMAPHAGSAPLPP